MHHNRQRMFIRRAKAMIALRGGSIGIVGEDDIVSTTGASGTVMSVQCFLVAMFLLFVARQRQRKTEVNPTSEVFDTISKYVGFACEAATSADLARVHVSLTQDVAVTLWLGTNGEVFGLESLLQYVPNLRAYWEAARETPFINDKTCFYVLSHFDCARCADFILVLSTFSTSSTSPQEKESAFWTHICIPILRALFTQLSELFRMQTWRINAVDLTSRPGGIIPGKTRNSLSDTPSS